MCGLGVSISQEGGVGRGGWLGEEIVTRVPLVSWLFSIVLEFQDSLGIFRGLLFFADVSFAWSSAVKLVFGYLIA